jgi:hypothetical protein
VLVVKIVVNFFFDNEATLRDCAQYCLRSIAGVHCNASKSTRIFGTYSEFEGKVKGYNFEICLF